MTFNVLDNSSSTITDINNWVVRGAVVATIAANCYSAPIAFAYNEDWAVSTSSVSKASSQGKTDALRQLELWVEETAFFSSPTSILESERYVRAREQFGHGIVQQLLNLIDEEPYHAVVALGDIVQPPPFSKSNLESISALANAWKQWGQKFEANDTEHIAWNIPESGFDDMVSDE